MCLICIETNSKEVGKDDSQSNGLFKINEDIKNFKIFLYKFYDWNNIIFISISLTYHLNNCVKDCEKLFIPNLIDLKLKAKLTCKVNSMPCQALTFIYILAKGRVMNNFIINLYNIITNEINCIGVTIIKYKMITPQ